MTESLSPFGAMAKAIEIAGSQSALSRICGVSQPSVSDWVRRMKQLPAEQVLKVEAATGVSRHDLRPDLYPREEPPAHPPAADPPQLAGGPSHSLAGVRR